MKWLATYYASQGWEVSGSDERMGGHSAENVEGANLVIYSSAIPPDNVELMQAIKLGLPVMGRGEALGEVAKSFGKVVAVAGTHGKSTVTAMTAFALNPRKVAMHLGGTIEGKTGSVRGEILVAEACEYKRNFLHLHPDVAVITNIELDHTDCYANVGEVREAFHEFASKAKKVILPAELRLFHRNVVTIGSGGDYELDSFLPDKEGSVVSIKTPNGRLHVRLNVIGRHNAQDAVFAVAVARECGASYKNIAKGLSEFRGVDRRLQRVGFCHGVPVFSDYAHHPTEVKATLHALSASGYVSPLVVFQPHTHERLRALLSAFASSLSNGETLLLPVFEARGNGKTSSHDLACEITALGGDARAFENFGEVATAVKNSATAHDVIVIMGAGDNEKILPLILEQMGAETF